MSNAPTERPWPPPPGQVQDQDQGQELSLVPAEPGLRPTQQVDTDAFPLWPVSGSIMVDGEEVEGVVVDRPLPPPAFLGAPGPDRVRSDEFATIVLEAVAPNRVPLAPTPTPAGVVRPAPEPPSAPEAPEDMALVRAPAPEPVWPVNPTPEPASSGAPAPPVPRKKRKEAAEQWPPAEMRATSAARSSTARVLAPRVAVRARPIRHARRPGPGLAWLLVFALLATFFAYTAAEPTWLALGHATRGTATVSRCQGKGVFRRCEATFVSRRFEATGVALVGADHVPGTATPARMVGPQGRIAYAGTNRSLLVRGLAGLLLVLLCGLGIAWVTGAGRLGTRRARNVARLLSVGLPLLIAIGVLAATY